MPDKINLSLIPQNCATFLASAPSQVFNIRFNLILGSSINIDKIFRNFEGDYEVICEFTGCRILPFESYKFQLILGALHNTVQIHSRLIQEFRLKFEGCNKRGVQQHNKYKNGCLHHFHHSTRHSLPNSLDTIR